MCKRSVDHCLELLHETCYLLREKAKAWTKTRSAAENRIKENIEKARKCVADAQVRRIDCFRLNKASPIEQSLINRIAGAQPQDRDHRGRLCRARRREGQHRGEGRGEARGEEKAREGGRRPEGRRKYTLTDLTELIGHRAASALL